MDPNGKKTNVCLFALCLVWFFNSSFSFSSLFSSMNNVSIISITISIISINHVYFVSSFKSISNFMSCFPVGPRCIQFDWWIHCLELCREVRSTMPNLRHWQSSRFEIVPSVEPIYVCWDVWTFNHLPVCQSRIINATSQVSWEHGPIKTTSTQGQGQKRLISR